MVFFELNSAPERWLLSAESTDLTKTEMPSNEESTTHFLCASVEQAN